MHDPFIDLPKHIEQHAEADEDIDWMDVQITAHYWRVEDMSCFEYNMSVLFDLDKQENEIVLIADYESGGFELEKEGSGTFDSVKIYEYIKRQIVKLRETNEETT